MHSTAFDKNYVYLDQFEGCKSIIQIKFENLEKTDLKLEYRTRKLV